MDWHHSPRPPPYPPPAPPLSDFSMGALMSGIYTRADNINENIAGLRREIRDLPAEIARHLATLKREEKPSMWDRIKSLRDFLRVLFPYLILVLVVLAKTELWPDSLPVIRTLLKLAVKGGVD